MGFVVVEVFRKIDDDLGGSLHVLKSTQPKCFVSFNIATALLSQLLLDLLLGCSSPRRCANAHLFRICSLPQICRTRTLENATFHKRDSFAQVPSNWSLHGMRVILPDGLRPQELFAFAAFFTSCDLGWVVGLARLFVSCQKLQFPSEHFPMAFH